MSGGRARCGLPGGRELRVRTRLDALPSQEDVEKAPEETRGERTGAGRRERRGDQAEGRRGEGAARIHPTPES